MPDNVLLERFHLESELIRRPLVKEVGADARADIILLCKEFPAHARQAHASAFRHIVRAHAPERFQAVGEGFLASLNNGILAMKGFITEYGFPLEGVLAELEKLRQEHQDRWLWFRQEEIDQARAEAEQGKTLELTDAFAQVAGVSREEWLRRVEDHKKRRQGA